MSTTMLRDKVRVEEKRKEIFFATTNLQKFDEAYRILASFNVPLRHLNLKTVEIQSDSLEEIAKNSLAQVLREHWCIVFVEDAGLFIEALNGFPGPYSSYVHRTLGVQGVLQLMAGVSDRRAHFISAVSYGMPNATPITFTGRVEGVIAHTSRGHGGFGFDPVFRPDGEIRTFAEMTLEEKNRYSHRAAALRRLGEWLIGRRS